MPVPPHEFQLNNTFSSFSRAWCTRNITVKANHYHLWSIGLQPSASRNFHFVLPFRNLENLPLWFLFSAGKSFHKVWRGSEFEKGTQKCTYHTGTPVSLSCRHHHIAFQPVNIYQTTLPRVGLLRSTPFFTHLISVIGLIPHLSCGVAPTPWSAL